MRGKEDEVPAALKQKKCPICNERHEKIEEHIRNQHTGPADIAFVKWVMRISKDVEDLKHQYERNRK
jgi:hypothetical protein